MAVLEHHHAGARASARGDRDRSTGHGETPAAADSGTFAGLADSVERFIVEHELHGVDIVGSSLGARIVLEMARRGRVGATVALDPGGFWRGWERTYFRTTLGASIRLIRALRPALPALSRFAVMRSALLAQVSARPWRLDHEVVATELQSFADTRTFDPLVHDLATGPAQEGPAADPARPLVIGWGRQDRLCLPRQAARAQEAFPSATLHWFSRCGHFPMWDRPDEAVRLILETTAGTDRLAHRQVQLQETRGGGQQQDFIGPSPPVLRSLGRA